MESCDVCGFTWESVEREEIPLRVNRGTAAIAASIVADSARSALRPVPQRWSALEYAAHARDVLLTIRDRLVIGLVEDEPSFTPMYREERVALGLYAADRADDIAGELRAAAAMFIRLFDAIDPQLLSRTVIYGFPTPTTRSLLWMGQQVVHEIEHHRSDILQNLAEE